MTQSLKRRLAPIVEELLYRVYSQRSTLGVAWYERQQRRAAQRWELAGRPVPPPEIVKQRIIREYGRRFGLDTLVETGTFIGDTPYELRNDFRRIITIELDPRLARNARKRLRRWPHIQVVEGDSERWLRGLAPSLTEPVLFWLDAHWSGGVTAIGAQASPALSELTTIMDRSMHRDVLLVDDARLFGTDGYPTLDDVEVLIHRYSPDWRFFIVDDIVRAHAPERPG
jgi:hypothetical protein